MEKKAIRISDMELISDELKNLLVSIGTLKKVQADTFLFQEGGDAAELYLIKTGLFQISKLTSDGRELNMRICKADDIIGELTLFSTDAKYMLSALSLADSEVLVIKKESLEAELIQNAALTFEFMRWISTHLRKNQSKIRDLMINGKKGALYSTLIRFTNSYGVQTGEGILIDIHLTNQEFAKFCAATRESVNRMLSELKKKDVISATADGKIIVKDLQYLKNEIGCEDCPISICNID
ncbi:Crp/Fnr family transcriptional regulator [Bacillus salacetis]|uniref:Crp/Fnr family transcriptional regulator n=1 Tax=Bacillus salacetis TaxID=2315464 RepID=A0A3A1R6T2_9BACI|nr:Crp/Fnr family transcriptional regulator [Bacillus salacetis]RIW38802.1 Crp/Fnr family transcriptional regulator [Bacillus salacetis]